MLWVQNYDIVILLRKEKMINFKHTKALYCLFLCLIAWGGEMFAEEK